MIKPIYILLIFLFITANESYANSIDYYDFECTGVLRMKNTTTLANWKINFINASRATLDIFYDKKKRSADLRISIQKNKDFYGNGKWRSQTAQGGRFIRIKYIDNNKQINLGGANAQFRADGQCVKKNKKLKITDIASNLNIIKERILIIKEHSKYAINHPNDIENIIRHLKHTCHALDPDLVKERPMPAGETGLHQILENIEKENNLIRKIKAISSSSIDKCIAYLYSWEKSNELLEIATYINLQFENLYKNFKKN
jgi:hypothetical protein